MPLETGGGRAAFSHNVATEMKAGKPQRQAVAIAYAQQRGDGVTGLKAQRVTESTNQMSGKLRTGTSSKTTWGVVDASGKVLQRGFWTKADAQDWIDKRGEAGRSDSQNELNVEVSREQERAYAHQQSRRNLGGSYARKNYRHDAASPTTPNKGAKGPEAGAKQPPPGMVPDPEVEKAHTGLWQAHEKLEAQFDALVAQLHEAQRAARKAPDETNLKKYAELGKKVEAMAAEVREAAEAAANAEREQGNEEADSGRKDAVGERTVPKDRLERMLRDGTWEMENEPDKYGRFTIRKGRSGERETMRLREEGRKDADDCAMDAACAMLDRISERLDAVDCSMAADRVAGRADAAPNIISVDPREARGAGEDAWADNQSLNEMRRELRSKGWGPKAIAFAEEGHRKASKSGWVKDATRPDGKSYHTRDPEDRRREAGKHGRGGKREVRGDADEDDMGRGFEVPLTHAESGSKRKVVVKGARNAIHARKMAEETAGKGWMAGNGRPVRTDSRHDASKEEWREQGDAETNFSKEGRAPPTSWKHKGAPPKPAPRKDGKSYHVADPEARGRERGKEHRDRRPPRRGEDDDERHDAEQARIAKALKAQEKASQAMRRAQRSGDEAAEKAARIAWQEAVSEKEAARKDAEPNIQHKANVIAEKICRRRGIEWESSDRYDERRAGDIFDRVYDILKKAPGKSDDEVMRMF